MYSSSLIFLALEFDQEDQRLNFLDRIFDSK